MKPWSIPPLWKNETAVILASGPSLTQKQVNYCRDKASVIAINDCYLLAPWADVHYFCDYKWWEWHRKRPEYQAFQGIRIVLGPAIAREDKSIKWLRNVSLEGLEDCSDGLRNGRNSGFAAINLAVHFGVDKIILLGYDMKLGKDGKPHWFGKHPNEIKDRDDKFFNNMYNAVFLPRFPSLIAPLKKRGVQIINATPGSALKCFPMKDLKECFSEKEKKKKAEGKPEA